MVVDKEKQKEEVFLYKLYTISSEFRRLTTPKPILLKEQVNNLEKILKTLQSSTNIISFLSSAYYNKNIIYTQATKNFQSKYILENHYMNIWLET